MLVYLQQQVSDVALICSKSTMDTSESNVKSISEIYICVKSIRG